MAAKKTGGTGKGNPGKKKTPLKKSGGDTISVPARKKKTAPPAEGKGAWGDNPYVNTFMEELEKEAPHDEPDAEYPIVERMGGLLGEVKTGPVLDHLDRFRGGFLIVLGLLATFTIAGFFLSDYILGFITRPFVESGQKLNIFTLTGGFMIRLRAAFGAAVLVTVPVIVYQLWRVIRPIMPKASLKLSRFLVFLAVLLFYGGIAFVYFIILPSAVTILIRFIGAEMLSTIGADDYLRFTLIFSMAMGVLFELPILSMILTQLGILTPQLLSKNRKYAIVIIWILAALITPTPDPLNQSFVAVPLMFFYEMSVIASRLIVRRRERLWR